MVTVHREGGFQIVIFTQDHEPAHVHVFGDGHAKFNLVGTDGEVELVLAERMKLRDLRRALRIIEAQRDRLLERWKDIHG